MSEYTVSQWVLFFYVYSLIGWIWECFYVSVRKGKFVNRGFLKGPLLPIYGSGAVCILLVTIPFRGNIPAMFVVGMVAASTLEYVTGWAMEKLFHVRYWDYSNNWGNLNGHICVGVSLGWGVASILMVEVVHSPIERLILQINEHYVQGLVMLITPCVTADFVTSFSAAIHLRDVLVQKERIAEELERLAKKREELEAALAGAGEKAREQIRQELRELYMNAGAKRARLQEMHTKAIRGLLRRNPTAVSRMHRENFERLKQTMTERFEELRTEIDERFDGWNIRQQSEPGQEQKHE